MPGPADALAAGPVLLDGGISTELERRGHDVSSALWSARLLHDAPDAVLQAHRAFRRAGAQVLTSASYQATVERFTAAGLSRATAEGLFRRSVALARSALDAAPGPGWVAGSVGPYGAFLADGSEYTGDYPTVGLREFHLPRMELLASAGADVLACETIPSAAEAEALIGALQELGRPGWISLTTTTAPDGSVRTRTGELAEPVFALARGVPEVIAVGVNCTDPEGAGPAVSAAAAASGKPVVVYPNSGERYSAGAWHGTVTFSAADAADWVRRGARLVGGCCRVGPPVIERLAAAFKG